jgi:hypothetical protein
MPNKYLAQIAGVLTEIAGLVTSAGAGDAGKLVATDGTGRLDLSLMPVGTDVEVQTITASENLSAGDFVNIWVSSGTKVRKADGSTTGKKAHGFVLAAVTSGASATVYMGAVNTQVTGATVGDVYLSATTPGGFTSTAPTGSGQTVQNLGCAVSATAIDFKPTAPIVLA